MTGISSLRLGSMGTPPASRVLTTSTLGLLGWHQISDAHVVTGAGILVDKLAKGTAATNQILVSNGTTNSFTSSPTAAGTITGNALVSSTTISGASISTTGNATFGGTIAGSNQTGNTLRFPLSGASINAQSATLTVGGGGAGIASAGAIGFAFVSDHSTGRSAIFAIQSSLNVGYLLAGDPAFFGVSASNDNRIHIFFSGGYNIYNGWGTAHFISATVIGSI